MHLCFTGSEARKSKVPFLLDASMQPITAANAWLQELAQDGATSSPCSWKTYAYHLFDYFIYLEAHHLDFPRRACLPNTGDVLELFPSSFLLTSGRKMLVY